LWFKFGPILPTPIRPGGGQNTTKPATVQASGQTKRKLADAEKQKRKIEHAKWIIRDTIA
jgi:hypothetical protein